MNLPIADVKSSVHPAMVAAFLRKAEGVSSVGVYGHMDEWGIDVTFRGVKYYLDRQIGYIQAFDLEGTGSVSNNAEFSCIVSRIPRGLLSGLFSLLRRR